MSSKPFAHRRVQVDGVAVERGSIYHGGTMVASAAGSASVAIHDGIDTRGEIIDYFYCSASNRDVHVLEGGVAVREGLYVDLGSNVSSFTVYYDPPEAKER